MTDVIVAIARAAAEVLGVENSRSLSATICTAENGSIRCKVRAIYYYQYSLSLIIITTYMYIINICCESNPKTKCRYVAY